MSSSKWVMHILFSIPLVGKRGAGLQPLCRWIPLLSFYSDHKGCIEVTVVVYIKFYSKQLSIYVIFQLFDLRGISLIQSWNTFKYFNFPTFWRPPPLLKLENIHWVNFSFHFSQTNWIGDLKFLSSGLELL